MKIHLVKYVIAICFLCTKAFGFQENDTITSNNKVFFIHEGVPFVDFEQDKYIILTNKTTIYLLPNTILKANKQLFANIQIITENKFSLTNNPTNLKVGKNIIYPKKEERKKIVSSSKINALPYNGRHSGFYLFCYWDYGIVPNKTNKYTTSYYLKNALSFYTSQPILNYKKRRIVYQKFIKDFALNIHFYCRPPPTV